MKLQQDCLKLFSTSHHTFFCSFSWRNRSPVITLASVSLNLFYFNEVGCESCLWSFEVFILEEKDVHQGNCVYRRCWLCSRRFLQILDIINSGSESISKSEFIDRFHFFLHTRSFTWWGAEHKQGKKCTKIKKRKCKIWSIYKYTYINKNIKIKCFRLLTKSASLRIDDLQMVMEEVRMMMMALRCTIIAGGASDEGFLSSEILFPSLFFQTQSFSVTCWKMLLQLLFYICTIFSPRLSLLLSRCVATFKKLHVFPNNGVILFLICYSRRAKFQNFCQFSF